MKRVSELLGVLSAAVSVMVLRPVNSYQGFMLKSLATAQTPALTLLGALATILGIRQRSLVATMCGALSAAIDASYIRRVTATHDGFESAFGSDWRRLLPPVSDHHMLKRRLTWRMPRVPEPRWIRDLPFWTIPGTDRRLLADL